jgi:hypothetical protein
MPQMVVWPFMAGTMIEDGFCVKTPPAYAAVASRAPERRERFGAAKTRPAPAAALS